MKKILSIVAILISLGNIHAQKLDLIIKTNSDSIACKIDSINSGNIYFSYRMQGSKIISSIGQNKVSEYKKNVLNRKAITFYPHSPQIKEIKIIPDLKNDNPFAHQYMVGPTGHLMKKGETSYETYGLFLHRIQHGYSDKFTMSFGGGYHFAGMIMANLTLSKKEKYIVSFHDALILVPYSNTYGNVSFVQYTYGSRLHNISVGAGVLLGYYKDESFASPAIILSGQVRLTKRLYFLHETYYYNLRTERIYVTPDRNEVYEKIQRSTNFAGMTGFNYIFKKRPWNSFKVGAVYNYADYGEIPDGYIYGDTNRKEKEMAGWMLLIYNRRSKK